MTYEEYKKTNKKIIKPILYKLLGKLFTISIFTMIIITLSNTNQKFRNFLINDILNNTMDFSKVNNAIDEVTNVFNTIDTTQTMNDINKNKNIEEYKDGYIYHLENNSNILLKDSGIVTYIGNKDDYLNTIVVQQSNGYYAWYGNVSEKVKLYDYIEKNEIIGTTNGDFYYYVLYKDDKPIKNEN